MSVRRGTGHRAQRTGLYAESKFTNWTRFNPSEAEIDRTLARFASDLHLDGGLVIRTVPLRSTSLVMPVTEHDVLETLEKVPKRFLSGLRAVFLLGGSRRQAKVAWSQLFAYGRYGSGCIFLHPFPVAQMIERWKTLPKPSIRREYERAGAVLQRVPTGWLRIFTPESLRTFYLREVLLHEVGHHVARSSRKDRRSAEAFADWVASEFGYAKIKRAT